jgi:hypothetical protein
MKFIETEIDRFSKEIKETYRPHWPSDMTASEVETSSSVRVSGPSGATNQIGVIGPTLGVGQTGPTGPVNPATSVFSYKTAD